GAEHLARHFQQLGPPLGGPHASPGRRGRGLSLPYAGRARSGRGLTPSHGGILRSGNLPKGSLRGTGRTPAASGHGRRRTMDFELSEDQLTMRKWVHEFAEREIRPVASQYDESEEFPWPVLKKAAEMGLYSIEFY